LMSLAVAPYAVDHFGSYKGIALSSWVYPQERDSGYEAFSAHTRSILEFFSDRIGPYAYEKLAHVQANGVGGGMELASSIFYGYPETGPSRQLIAHEMAPQWFGNAVTESDWDDVWLSEGFATYYTLLFRNHAYGRDDFVAGLKDARRRVVDFYNERPDYRVIHDNLDDMSQVTSGMTYQKGAWVLHMLREKLGAETYDRGVRNYYREYRDANVTTADFRRFMEEASGQDLSKFFDQWLYQ